MAAAHIDLQIAKGAGKFWSPRNRGRVATTFEKKHNMDTSRLRITPLGGLGEIGLNCTMYELDNRVVVVDAGVLFAGLDAYGIDVVIPDFSEVFAAAERLDGIVITHGHEDHIGALPFLLQKVRVPVYGTRFTLALIAAKLPEFGLKGIELIEIEPRNTYEIGAFVVEPIQVSHSIAGSVSLAFHTPLGIVLHTGDFKVDFTANPNNSFDRERFAQLGEEGVALLLSDSTNIEVDGYTRDEAEVGRQLAELIGTAKGRVCVTLFASNIYRVQSILNACHDAGRVVHLNGRSLLKTFRVARELGFISVPRPSMFIDAGEVDRYEPEEVAIVLTGSQGEPRSSLSRMALGVHKQLRVEQGDVVIFSSRIIPGNGRQIANVTNNLYRRKARVITERTALVHCSGHACREELRLMLNLTNPRAFVPIHGEHRHLVQHADLAREFGVGQVTGCENGDVLELSSEGLTHVDHVASGRVFVELGGSDVADMVLRDRRKLAETGILIAAVILDTRTGDILSGPDLFPLGIARLADDDDLLEGAHEAAFEAIEQLGADSRRDVGEVEETLRLHLRRFFKRLHSRKPVVIPVVHEL